LLSIKASRGEGFSFRPGSNPSQKGYQMAKANRAHSTPRRTASKIKAKKRARKVDLAAAAAELTAIDDSIEAMHKKYDDADSRKDYRRLSRRRFDLLHIFGSTPALSLGDIEAKAAALSQRTLEDYTNTAMIAESLAKDILKGLPTLIALGDDRPVASLPRAEQIVELLTTCYVREGWKIDEAAAERALAYCRKYAEDGSDPDDERRAAMDFFHSHGQSLDWVFAGDIRGMICGIAKHSQRAADVAGPIEAPVHTGPAEA
jgi:hypothetical protein